MRYMTCFVFYFKETARFTTTGYVRSDCLHCPWFAVALTFLYAGSNVGGLNAVAKRCWQGYRWTVHRIWLAHWSECGDSFLLYFVCYLFMHRMQVVRLRAPPTSHVKSRHFSPGNGAFVISCVASLPPLRDPSQDALFYFPHLPLHHWNGRIVIGAREVLPSIVAADQSASSDQ